MVDISFLEDGVVDISSLEDGVVEISFLEDSVVSNGNTCGACNEIGIHVSFHD